jgi:hypothetical protein
MATWEVRAARLSRRESTGTEMLRLLAAGLLVAVVTWAPYSILRGGPGPFVRPSDAREGALEVTPDIHAARVPVTTPLMRALSAAGVPAGRVVLAFGRFERRAAAEARARLVRSKGYIARVVQAGEAYLVVSRPYRNHADAQFWSSIFSELGLQATALTRLEASAPQMGAVDAIASYWRKAKALSPSVPA